MENPSPRAVPVPEFDTPTTEQRVRVAKEFRGRVIIESPAELPDPRVELIRDVRAGFSARPRHLSPKYLYDAEGSRIYEEITRLDEYYPFRTERGILTKYAGAIADASCSQVVVEFGSGAASKTRILLDELKMRGVLDGYGAIEVSESALRRSLEALAAAYPDIICKGLVADFNGPVDLPFPEARRLILFLGSTIGNLDDEAAHDLLTSARGAMDGQDRFLVGFDLVKDKAVLERAYDDRLGVTARFNLNLLTRLNRELGADFDLAQFRHKAFFNSERSRIEMHLESLSQQSVHIPGADLSFEMEAGETIHTEVSRKFEKNQVLRMAEAAGLRLDAWMTDERDYFAVGLFSKAEGRGGKSGESPPVPPTGEPVRNDHEVMNANSTDEDR
ncbi:MAG: L-histidine N(alpha)-methyltransferase [Gemmatimonadetes bacterium]|nr:L-histidine N(alpha)-methyltransferase [Gemmatimonadota bacterium]